MDTRAKPIHQGFEVGQQIMAPTGGHPEDRIPAQVTDLARYGMIGVRYLDRTGRIPQQFTAKQLAKIRDEA